jgi:hypothetical protein
MKAVELLLAPQVDHWFARMEDETYRWVSDDLRLLPDGPDAAWVEQAVRTPDVTGLPTARQVPNHDEELAELNANLASEPG